MTSSETYRFEQFDGYSVITLLPHLNDSQWADIEKVGTELVDRLKTSENPRFLVDLSLLSYMGSAMVALIVRLWKSVKDTKKGRMVVVNQHEMVFEVLKLAGLHKVWTIVPTRDEGLKALGITARSTTSSIPGAAVSIGETRDASAICTIVGLVSIVVAGIGLAILLKSSPVVSGTTALLIVVLAAAVGLISGMISAVKESDWRQKVGIGVVVASVVLVLAGVLMAPSGAANAAAPDQAPPAASVPAAANKKEGG